MLREGRAVSLLIILFCGLLLAVMHDGIDTPRQRSQSPGRSNSYDDPVLHELRELEIRFRLGAICYR
jgi:hypothetical protein